MKIEFIYNSDVFVLPGSAMRSIKQAGIVELRFLLALASDSELRSGHSDVEFYQDCIIRASKAAGCTEAEANMALAFWRGAGVLNVSDGNAVKKEAANNGCESDSESNESNELTGENSAEGKAAALNENTPDGKSSSESQNKGKKLTSADKTPDYTGDELEAIFSRDKNIRGLIDECQNIVGKVFNPHEIGKIVAMSDYLGLEHEHILLLFSYCRERGKTSVAYIEKTAYNLYNEGVDTTAAFEEYIKRKEQQNDRENKLRKLFGLGDRTITPRERNTFSLWFDEFGMSCELIERAYQITVDNTDKLSLPYLTKVLSNWHDSGYKTVADVDRALDEYRKAKAESTAGYTNNGNSDGGKSVFAASGTKSAGYSSKEGQKGKPASGSFDTDDFFELALKRSYGIIDKDK